MDVTTNPNGPNATRTSFTSSSVTLHFISVTILQSDCPAFIVIAIWLDQWVMTVGGIANTDRLRVVIAKEYLKLWIFPRSLDRLQRFNEF